ncbi:hypothetical protein SLS59_006037 [Nothophoma quercina]|uniref:Uncharacterized protein n=1 Tax=Nothophoma quercina TaxID=749835 RepID=A0ABR3R6A0_9PLEO
MAEQAAKKLPLRRTSFTAYPTPPADKLEFHGETLDFIAEFASLADVPGAAKHLDPACADARDFEEKYGKWHRAPPLPQNKPVLPPMPTSPVPSPMPTLTPRFREVPPPVPRRSPVVPIIQPSTYAGATGVGTSTTPAVQPSQGISIGAQPSIGKTAVAADVAAKAKAHADHGVQAQVRQNDAEQARKIRAAKKEDLKAKEDELKAKEDELKAKEDELKAKEEEKKAKAEEKKAKEEAAAAETEKK